MEQELRKRAGRTDVIGRELLYFEELDSTNTYAKKLARSEALDGTVIIADSQTAGRGRLDRSFQSPAGKGLYLSVLLRPALPAERLLPLTALAGVAVCDAVERVCGVRPGLKWPNDPVLGGRKLCGILTELVLDERTGGVQAVVLGIGVNVLQTSADFSPDVAEMATSLSMELGAPVDRPELAAALLEELDRAYAALRCGTLSGYLAAYRRDCVNLNRTVRLIRPDGNAETGVATEIDEEFGLKVRFSDGTERVIRSGEVSVRGMYGYVDA